MNELLTKLKLKNISSARSVERLAADETELRAKIAATMSAEGSVIAWYFSRVVWGRYESGVVTFSDGTGLVLDGLEELRVFNASEELRLVRAGRDLRLRYIVDGDGESQDVVDSAARLWGERVAVEPGYTTLEDAGRHFRMTVPADSASRSLLLVTRSYVDYDKETGLAGYSDYRYVEIIGEE